MAINKINILSTRPLDDLLIHKAAGRNIFIDTASFIETEPLVNTEISGRIRAWEAKKITAVFTSRNAVEAVTRQLSSRPDWQIYCIGGITKELVFKFFGEAAVIASAKNATALAEKIIAISPVNKLVFFSGDQRLDDLPEKLAKTGISMEECIVYTSKQTPQLVEKSYQGILFFSPSAVHSFFSLNTIPTSTVLFSIGKTTSATIQSYCVNKIITSEWPGKEPMIEQVMHYFQTVKQA